MLISEWKPEPLIDEEKLKELSEINIGLDVDQSMLVTCSSTGNPYISLVEDGKPTDHENFASFGFLNYQMHPDILHVAEEAIRVCGVGPCGPRGFYGTSDYMLRLERTIAKFMGTPDAVVYSSGFATISSVVPAFAKPEDYIFFDASCSFAIQTAVTLSRTCNAFIFKHNDVNDLRGLLSSKPIFSGKNRIFVILEAIYFNYGDICLLPQILKLKQEFPFRIILDESLSVGVLGKYGRGLTEYYDLPINSVEIITASISNAIGSSGGFSVGSSQVTSHQRLNASGYVFSCSLPPFCVAAAIKALEFIQQGDDVALLQRKIKWFHQVLISTIRSMQVFHDPNSPIAHLRLKSEDSPISMCRIEQEKAIQKMVHLLRCEKKILVVKPFYSKKEHHMPLPSIRISLSIKHTDDDIANTVKSIEEIASRVLMEEANGSATI